MCIKAKLQNYFRLNTAGVWLPFLEAFAPNHFILGPQDASTQGGCWDCKGSGIPWANLVRDEAHGKTDGKMGTE